MAMVGIAGTDGIVGTVGTAGTVGIAGILHSMTRGAIIAGVAVGTTALIGAVVGIMVGETTSILSITIMEMVGTMAGITGGTIGVMVEITVTAVAQPISIMAVEKAVLLPRQPRAEMLPHAGLRFHKLTEKISSSDLAKNQQAVVEVQEPVMSTVVLNLKEAIKEILPKETIMVEAISTKENKTPKRVVASTPEEKR
jgi:hypothetical protein